VMMYASVCSRTTLRDCWDYTVDEPPAAPARPLRSPARLSLGRSLSAQCSSAGGVSHQPRT
jgi:hypothetical protein